jgi:CDGSH-type Zn-finger protein/uncharacterized Fe-S cluster protein YjdI
MPTTREQLIHTLYEAAELEHSLMCTYLYAAFSLKDGESEGLSRQEAQAVARWRRTIFDVAIDEMGHLAAVWNITAAVGGAPRLGRTNFPLDPGYLPAGIVVKLAPFSAEVLQHFVFLERPAHSEEAEGNGFEPARVFSRTSPTPRLTPMGSDYATVGQFYTTLQERLVEISAALGVDQLFCGDPSLQLSSNEIDLTGAKPVICLKTALAACQAIVDQGEGASEDQPNSHFNKFLAIRDEFAALSKANPGFAPAYPAAHNPVLRRPPNPEGRVWIDDPQASAIVDLANSSYQLMLRLLSHTYATPSPSAEKSLAVDLGLDLMRALTWLGESAARRPAGPDNPNCNAGVSFTALRDAAALPRGASARRFFVERLGELAEGAANLDQSDQRIARATGLLRSLTVRARGFDALAAPPTADLLIPKAPTSLAEPSTVENGVERVTGDKVDIEFSAKLCIHSRFCVTQAPNVFLANVEGPWIHPNAVNAEELAAVARNCPSGAIRYRRKDGGPQETAPPVNLIRTLEGGPNAFRGDLYINGASIGYRATLCRCGASKNKPFCDSSHHGMAFDASGEPATWEQTNMLAQRDGPIAIAPQADGPLMVRGNLEIVSGTGRLIARLNTARLCRCGHSQTKPFCDGSHVKAGFKSMG